METYIPITDAARIAHKTESEIQELIKVGTIKAAKLFDGALIVNIKSIPTNREETEEYRAVSHLRGVGIGINQAAKKYGVNYVTIGGWVKRGLIRRLSGETVRGQRVLIDESDVAYIAEIYKRAPGQGKRTIEKIS